MLSIIGGKRIRLDDDVDERLRENKRDDETFSGGIERLLGRRSLAELWDVLDDGGRGERVPPFDEWSWPARRRRYARGKVVVDNLTGTEINTNRRVTVATV